MNYNRTAGILLHPTSLPSKYGIGVLGEECFRFIDFLEAAGQTLWQVFPLGPTGFGDSPYQCLSAFAGNFLLICPDELIKLGLLTREDISNAPVPQDNKINYGQTIEFKKNILKKSFVHFLKAEKKFGEQFESFCAKNKLWLDDFSLFAAAKDYHNGSQWTDWDHEIKLRTKNAMAKWRNKLSDEIKFHKFIQFIFFYQWKRVKDYANNKNIKIIGDIPIFISFDSADLWANRKLFHIDSNGNLLYCAGVPPDYFSPTGQRWGNPLYDWKEMAKNDYLWWRKRLSTSLEMYDICRIDHFRGFEAYWQIPADAPTAETGKWIKGPADKFFKTILNYLGDIPIIAEDLGVITKEVDALRDKFGFPGMKVFQFAFGPGMQRLFLPHNMERNCVVYTGTHDNDTTRSFFENAKNENRSIYEHAAKYLNYWGDDICFELIRLAYSSVANMVIIPMQDALNLGAEARMNFPGTIGNNWSWRFNWQMIPDNLADRLKELSLIYERS